AWHAARVGHVLPSHRRGPSRARLATRGHTLARPNRADSTKLDHHRGNTCAQSGVVARDVGRSATSLPSVRPTGARLLPGRHRDSANRAVAALGIVAVRKAEWPHVLKALP